MSGQVRHQGWVGPGVAPAPVVAPPCIVQPHPLETPQEIPTGVRYLKVRREKYFVVPLFPAACEACIDIGLFASEEQGNLVDHLCRVFEGDAAPHGGGHFVACVLFFPEPLDLHRGTLVDPALEDGPVDGSCCRIDHIFALPTHILVHVQECWHTMRPDIHTGEMRQEVVAQEETEKDIVVDATKRLSFVVARPHVLQQTAAQHTHIQMQAAMVVVLFFVLFFALVKVRGLAENPQLVALPCVPQMQQRQHNQVGIQSIDHHITPCRWLTAQVGKQFVLAFARVRRGRQEEFDTGERVFGTP